MTEKVRVGLYVSPPDAYPCASSSMNSTPLCETPGIVANFLHACLQRAGLTYEVTSVGRHLGAFLPDQSKWSGLFGELHNGTIDTIATFATYSQIREKYFLYTRFFDSHKYVFLIKLENLKISQGTLLLVDGFSKEVWSAIFFMLILLVCTLAFVKCTFKNGDSYSNQIQTGGGGSFEKLISSPRIVLGTLWNTIRFSLAQSEGNPFDTRGVSANCIFIFLSLLTVVFINLYQTVVYDQIKSVSRDPPFRSTQELVSLISTGQLTLITHSPDIAYFDGVNNSEADHFQLIRSALKKNPIRLVSSSAEAFRKLESDDGGSYVYVCLRYAAMRLAQKNCEIVIVDVDTPTMWNGFIVNKNRPDLMRKLDKAAVQVLGYMEVLHEKFKKRYRRNCGTQETAPLSISTLSGVFVLYMCAIGVAVVALVAEAIVWLRWRWVEMEKRKRNEGNRRGMRIGWREMV